MTKKDLNQRIGRWILDLQEYDFEMLHRSSARMNHVDALSRNPVKNQTLRTFLNNELCWQHLQY